MADKEKKVNPKSEVGKAPTDAEKVAKAAKGSAKKNKPNIFSRAGKGAKRFYKDFKGESKKIVWPDARTVLKSTGIVLLVVIIVSLLVFAIDQSLSFGIGGLENLANPTTEATTVADESESTTAADDDSTTEAEDDTTEAKDDATEASTEVEDDTTEAETEAE